MQRLLLSAWTPYASTPITPNQTPAKTFAQDYYQLFSVDPKQRRVVSILSLVYELWNASGIDYRANLPGLIQDAKVFTRGIPLLDVLTARAVTDTQAGATATNIVLGLDYNSVGRSLLELTEQDQERIITYLRGQMAL